MTSPLNMYSRQITQNPSHGGAQAMLLATGLVETDLDKPQVGIAATWWEGNPCNMHLNELAARVKEGVAAAGLVGLRFNTIGVSDGISQGTEGMSYSLQSRDLIADSIETLTAAQWYDGLVTLPGCDKNMPGCVMAMARLNIPSVFVYGGSIMPGVGPAGEDVDIVSIFEAVGQYQAKSIDEKRLRQIECESCPGAGACGGMYTANTMSSAIEALGMSLPNSSAQNATSEAKKEDCRRAGATVFTFYEIFFFILLVSLRRLRPRRGRRWIASRITGMTVWRRPTRSASPCAASGRVSTR